MPKTPDHDAVIAALAYPKLIQRLKDSFSAPIVAPARHAHAVETGEGRPAAVLLLMPAWGMEGMIGLKVVTVHPDLSARPNGAVRSSYLVFDAGDGELRAVLDAHVLTNRRTAAQSVLAATLLAKPDPRRLIIAGAGAVAEALAEAYGATFPGLAIDLWARRPDAAQVLADKLARAGVTARPVPDLRVAARAADIVACATTSTLPLLTLADVAPGAHVDLVGAFRADMREAADDLVAAARIVVDTENAIAEGGDVAQPLAAGLIRRADVATLAETIRRKPSRRPDEITLFKSVGHAAIDLAAASLLVDAGLI